MLPFQNHRPPQDSHNRRRSSEQPQAHTASRQDHFTLHRNKGSSEQQLTLPPKTRGRDRGPRSRGVPAGSSGAHDTTAAEERPHSTPGPPFHRKGFLRVPRGCVSGNQEALVDERKHFLARKLHLINVEEKPGFRMITSLQCPVKRWDR